MAIINHKRKIQLVCNFQRSGEITLLTSIQFIFYLGNWKFEGGRGEMTGESLNCNTVAFSICRTPLKLLVVNAGMCVSAVALFPRIAHSSPVKAFGKNHYCHQKKHLLSDHLCIILWKGWKCTKAQFKMMYELDVINEKLSRYSEDVQTPGQVDHWCNELVYWNFT